LGYVKYFEGENEIDRWWIGHGKADCNGREMAAYMSSIFDGHQNTMVDPDGDPNVKFGVMNADPSAKVVMGGIAYLDYAFLEDMIAWCEENRTDPNYPTYPWHVIIFHDYPNTERKQRNLAGKGMPPEQYGWRGVHRRLRNWLDERVPGNGWELWNTEFGYDTNQGSPQRCEPYGPFNAEEVQAMWLNRCFLEMFPYVDRATQFYLRDNDSNSSGIFGSCGLTVKSESYRPKVSWYYLYAMKKALTGYEYVQDLVLEDNLRVMEFAHQETGKQAFAVWSPTWDNSTRLYNLNVKGDGGSIITPINGSTTGDVQRFNGDSISISAWENPSFVIVD
jgi:hypothetical protein